MLGSKDLYIIEHERLTGLAEDAGMSWEEAYEATADAAHDALFDRVAEMADQHRQRVKDARLFDSTN